MHFSKDLVLCRVQRLGDKYSPLLHLRTLLHALKLSVAARKTLQFSLVGNDEWHDGPRGPQADHGFDVSPGR